MEDPKKNHASLSLFHRPFSISVPRSGWTPSRQFPHHLPPLLPLGVRGGTSPSADAAGSRWSARYPSPGESSKHSPLRITTSTVVIIYCTTYKVWESRNVLVVASSNHLLYSYEYESMNAIIRFRRPAAAEFQYCSSLRPPIFRFCGLRPQSFNCSGLRPQSKSRASPANPRFLLTGCFV